MAVDPGKLLEATTSTIWGGGGDTHESDQSLLYFTGSELSHHLHHVNADSLEAIEGLIYLLYDRVYGGVSRKDMARNFIALGRERRSRRGRNRIIHKTH